jgi:polysaccharide biosynthesis transport protein
MSYLPPPSDPARRGLSLSPGAARVANPAVWPASSPEQSSQLLEYLRVMRANLGWIAALAVVGAGLGWITAALRPAMYQARTMLDIRSLNENFLNPRDGSPIGTTASVLPESYIQTEIKILSSDSLRQRVLKRLRVAEPAPKGPGAPATSFWASWLAPFRSQPISLNALAVDAARRVKVRAVGNTRMVEVLCDARDGQLAADMCNDLAHTYIEYNLESRQTSTQETGAWLQSQLDDVRRRLTKAENDLKDASKETAFLFDSNAADNPAEDKLREVQTELSRAEAERIARESDYQVAASRSVYALPMGLDNGPIRDYRMRLAELRRQLAEASATMTPQHYKVKELTREVADMEKALNKEHDDLVNRLKADFDVARNREAALADAYKRQAAEVSQHGDKAVQYNMLKREVDSDRKMYETLLQKVDEVGLSAALHTSTISVLDPAVPPSVPYAPSVHLSMAVGLFGGSLAGLSLAFLRVRSDRTFQGPGDASMYLQVRELGVIPSIRNRSMRLILNRMRLSLANSQPAMMGLNDEVASPGLPLSETPSTSTALSTWLRSPEVNEAFFGTMSSLRFATERGARASVIVLTSPDAGEGKTTVATNLAIALVQIGRRVILVDGDLRRPRLAQLFDCPCDTGLAELLDADGPLESLPLDRYVVRTDIPNLNLLPTRPARDGVCNKLHSVRMKALLSRLRQEYDHVIIDSPPMLHIADARVLGWLSDGVLLVLRARKTTRDSALAAYDCLVQDGTQVLGTILNDWNPRGGEKYTAYKSVRIA